MFALIFVFARDAATDSLYNVSETSLCTFIVSVYIYVLLSFYFPLYCTVQIIELNMIY